MAGLKNAPVKSLVLVEGGDGAAGKPCEGMHRHGFVGMEKEAVNTIVGWIRKPSTGP